MNIILLRHGATRGNEEHRYVGTTDEALTPESIRKLAAAAGGFRTRFLCGRPVLLLVSPMKRCRQTAELLTGGLAADSFSFAERVVPDFRETDFGAFEYKTFAQLDGDPEYQRFIDSGGKTPFPGGESRSEVQERVTRAFREELGKLSGTGCPPDTIVVICHGGTIMSLMERFAVPHRPFYDWQCANLAGFSGRLALLPEPRITEVKPLTLA